MAAFLSKEFEMIKPAIGSVWRHTNGNLYRVIALANYLSTKPEYPPTVVYQNIDNHTVWSRPDADWLRSFTVFVE